MKLLSCSKNGYTTRLKESVRIFEEQEGGKKKEHVNDRSNLSLGFFTVQFLAVRTYNLL